MKKNTPPDKIFLKSIGQNIKQIRKENFITQEELANLASIDRSYLGGVERGERNISIIILYKIALALKVDTEKLLAISKDKKL